MNILKDLTNEELIDEFAYIIESVSKISESNYYIELRNEIFSRMKQEETK